MAGVLLNEALAHGALGLLDHFVHEVEAVLDRSWEQRDHQALRVGAIGVQFQGFVDESQSLA